jgi:hypothetical protein
MSTDIGGKGTLRLTDDGWQLEAEDEAVIDSGDYPLREDTAFIESAAEVLGWNYHHKPYTKVDERNDESDRSGT